MLDKKSVDINDREKNWDEYIEPRIKVLQKNGFDLESFYLCSATIEHSLQCAIQLQEEWIAKVVTRSKLKFEKTDTKKLEGMTLGQLILLYSRYSNDQKLISQLNQFNSLRIKFIHKLLDTSIQILNEEAKKNFIL